MGYMLELDEDDVSEIADTIDEVLEQVECDCEPVNNGHHCNGGCLKARLNNGYEVLLRAGA